MKSIKTKNRKRTNSDLKHYKDAVKSKTIENEETASIGHLINLETSDEVDNNIESKNENIPLSNTPIKYKIEEWFKSNWVEIIIGGILITVLGWTIGNIIDIKIDINNINYKIEIIEKDIDKLDNDKVTRTELQLQIDSIKTNLNYNINQKDINEINKKLDDIQKRIGD